jgi:23S rRNA (cytosine1962-C5)-methyltransferase
MSYRALTLGKDAAAKLEGGVCDLPGELFRENERGEPGQPVRLVSPQGDPLGVGVADPENELVRVFAMTAHEEHLTTIDAAFFRARVDRAAALRKAFGLAREITAHRLVNGAADGLPGMTADLYGDFAVLWVWSRGMVTLGRLCAEAIVAATGVRGVVLKVRAKDTAREQSVKQEMIGETPPERFLAREDDLSLEVHLLAGLNVGLFTDMREHRRGLARFARGRTVLNTFSYTGSLSIAAARAGAKSVTSVDLSSGVHKWAMENFRSNGLDPAQHRFEAEDVMVFLKRAAREQRKYDLAILDPPTWSAARAAAWSMKSDYPELIVRACAVLAEGGLLWLSANARELPSLAGIAQTAFQRAKRPAQLLETGSLPPDHPTLVAQPGDRYLQLCLFRVD